MFGEPKSAMENLWWLLGIIFLLFLAWVALGGPQRANKENIEPFIKQPNSVGSGSQTPQ